MGWDGPILTDSGGFQVFSLAKLRQVRDDGITFQSHLDGATIFLGPREVMAIQRNLGSDVAMVLDECPPCRANARSASARSSAAINGPLRVGTAAVESGFLAAGHHVFCHRAGVNVRRSPARSRAIAGGASIFRVTPSAA